MYATINHPFYVNEISLSNIKIIAPFFCFFFKFRPYYTVWFYIHSNGIWRYFVFLLNSLNYKETSRPYLNLPHKSIYRWVNSVNSFPFEIDMNILWGWSMGEYTLSPKWRHYDKNHFVIMKGQRYNDIAVWRT